MSCPSGYYGDDCRETCECSADICNATFGCHGRYDLNYLNPTTLSIVIPTTLGLICLFILIGTLIVLKMRQNAQRPQPESMQNIIKTYDVTSGAVDSRTYNDLGPQDDFPPPPYDDDFIDCTAENKVYETCT